MRNLFLFLAKYNAFIVFLLLEIVCFTLIVKNNHFQRVSFVNSANAVAGNLLKNASEARNFVQLSTVNDSLTAENARLHKQLQAYRNELASMLPDYQTKPDSTVIDSSQQNTEIADNPIEPNPVFDTYSYIGANVINNSTQQANNFLTLNKGKNHGIASDMGVIGTNGIVGVTKDVSANFTTVISVLHKSMYISGKMKQNQFKGSLSWDGIDPQYVNLNDVPKHAPVAVGDTIVTSGFSAFFPPDVMIGTVAKQSLKKGSNFHDISVKLSTDFNSISYVYITENTHKAEQKKLEAASQNE